MKKLFVALMLMPLMALADTETVDGITWTYKIIDGKAQVGMGSSSSRAISTDTVGAITIPSTLGGCPVTSIGDYAFYSCSGLTSVIISEGVTSIGDFAFQYCSGVTSVAIPEGVVRIGDSAFDGCGGLVSVTMPEGVRSIGNYAFFCCNGLTSVTIPSSVARIGFYAFVGTPFLDDLPDGMVVLGGGVLHVYKGECPPSVTIPSSVTSIGEYAFYGCSMLSFVTIPEGVTSIGEEAFNGCKDLRSVRMPSSVTSIGTGAFSDCSSLTRVDITNLEKWCDISFGDFYANPLNYSARGRLYLNGEEVKNLLVPEGVTSIEDYAFSGCSGLASVTIPLGVTSIGRRAFCNCTGLTSVTIPSSVTSIETSAFLGCSGLSEILAENDGGTFLSIDGILYDKTGTKLIRCPEGRIGLMTIPSSVTSIGDNAFSGCKGLTSVTIPSRVTSIGDNAFSGCSGLTSVTIPSSVTSIGGNAFYGCSGLTAVTIPACVTRLSIAFPGAYNMNIREVTICDGVTNVGDYAFSGCKGLTSVMMPSSVTSIGEYAFSGCEGLASVAIPSSVTSIGISAFSGCDGLMSVTIPNGVTRIEERTFDGCSGLTSVVIPSSVTNIGDLAFQSCGGLTSVMIPEGVSSIEQNAFRNCSGLTEIAIPSSVTSIGSEAFYYCRRLTSVTMPSSVMNIGRNAFIGTQFLENQPNGMVVLGGGVLHVYKGECPSSLTIPSNVKSIGNCAFYACNGLKSVTISEGVTSIGDGAFIYCSELTTVTIPSSVTSIGREAFYGCGLTEVTIPEGVVRIGDSAFFGCGGLRSVTIPSSVASIGRDAFGRFNAAFTEGVNVVKISDLSAWCRIAFDNYISNPLCYGAKLVLNSKEVTDLIIPNGVTLIGSNAFSGCSSLTSVTIPSSVTSIGDWAFYGCSRLTSVTIPSNVKHIGEWAFYKCSGLNSVTIHEGVATIGSFAFYKCSGLKSVTIPEGVTSIGSSVFEDCSGLTSVTMPSSVTSIGDSAFSGCTSLADENGFIVVRDILYGYCGDATMATIPSSVASIGDSAFSRCSGLTSVTMPSSVTNIGDYAFYGCSGLTSVTIPSSVTSIGSAAFSNCSGLTSVMIFKGVTSIGDVAFKGCDKLDVVYVVKGDAERVKSLYYGWPWAVSFIDVVDVTFDLSNRGIRHSGGELYQRLIAGETADAPVVCPVEGWRFVGWDGDIARPIISDTIFMAVYEPIVYSIGYANTKDVDNPNPSAYTVTNKIVFAALPDTDEYWFGGWKPAKIEVGTTGDLVVTAKWDRIQGVAEATGDQNREWVSSGDTDWFVAWNDEKGKYVVRSGEIGNSQTSVLETVVMNGGTVSFAVATSCEPSYRGKIRTDGLSFSVDGNEVLWLDSESGWTNVLWSVTGEGAHKLKWKYGKDVEGVSGMDCAFLSEFTFYHEVVVNFSGGDAKEGDAPSPIFSYNGAEITLPPLGTLRNPRHAFVGWSDGETVYQPGDRFLLGDVAPVFIAQWAAKRLSAPIISVPPFYTTEKTTVRISAEAGAEVRYTLDGSDPTMTSAAYEGPFEIAGSMTVKAAAFREDWFDSPVVSATTVRAPWTYGECLNSEMQNFSSEGAGAWVRDLSVTHDGVAALCCGAIGNNATSRLELVVVGGGELTFWWKASTEVYRGIPMDSGVLVVDGEDAAEIYGEADWARKAVVLPGNGRHTIRWEFRKDEEDDPLAVGDDCVWLDEVKWTSFTPSVVNDEGATVTGDAETGFVIKPSEGTMVVEVTIPQGVDAAKVTVAVSVKVESVKSNGAKVKIVSGDADITEFLDLPAAVNGVIDLAQATVKDEIVKEPLDTTKGAKIELRADDPKITTAPTKPGLTYTLREGEALGGMKDGDSTIGNG